MNIRHSDTEKVPLWTGHGYDHRGYRIRAPGPVNRVLLSEPPTIDALYEMLAGTEVAALLLMWGVIIAAAILRAFTGFGFALAAVPVFSLFMPPTQAVVLTASLALAISLLSIRTYWGKYPLGAMAPMFFMSLVGTGTGVLLLTSISGQRFQLYIGIAVILACVVLTFYRPGKVRPGPGWSIRREVPTGVIRWPGQPKPLRLPRSSVSWKARWLSPSAAPKAVSASWNPCAWSAGPGSKSTRPFATPWKASRSPTCTLRRRAPAPASAPEPGPRQPHRTVRTEL